MKLVKDLARLNSVTNELADEIKTIRLAMPGKGITPSESPIKEARFLEIENKLRMIGSNQADIIPF